MNMRLAVPADVEKLADLRQSMLRELVETLPEELPGATRAYLEKHIADGSCICALLEIQGEIAAMAMLCSYVAMPDEVNIEGRGANLCAVYTLPAFRGKGYMEQLLRYLLEEARGRKIRVINAAAEQKAIPLYERVGFQRAETILYMDL